MIQANKADAFNALDYFFYLVNMPNNMNYMEWGHCFSEYQILVPYEFLVWNIFFKKKKKRTHEDDLQNQGSCRFC